MKAHVPMPSINSIVSFAFRCLVILYAFLVLIFERNSLSFWIYTVCIILYFTVFIVFRKRGELGGVMRLINDYSFITLILYDKQINLLNTCLLLAPIINSSNYTGKYGLIASLRLYIAALISLLVINKFAFEPTWLIPLAIFWALSNITKAREFIKNMKLILSNPVGQISLEQITPYSTHRNRVLKEVIEHFNNNRFLKIFHPVIDTAICFKLKRNNIIIVSSSRLIMDYSLRNAQSTGLDVEDSLNLDEVQVSIDSTEKSKDNYFLYRNKVGANDYLYYIEFLHPPLVLIVPFIKRILAHTFGTLSNVFEIEDSIKRRRLNLVKSLKKQAVFLERSTHNIHFINNKLTPILEYFTLKKSIANGEIEPSVEITEIVNELQVKSDVNINMIVNRLARHLDKKGNPFFSLQFFKLTIEQIVISVTNTWGEHDLSLESLSIVIDDRTSLKKVVNFQSECFEVVLDEIIENIIKRRYVWYKCSITIFSNQVVFRFQNDIKSAFPEDLKPLVSQFNSNLLSEMAKRSSHGLSMMKNYLLLMNIESSISVASSIYTIVLTLPIKTVDQL